MSEPNLQLSSFLGGRSFNPLITQLGFLVTSPHPEVLSGPSISLLISIALGGFQGLTKSKDMSITWEILRILEALY